mgnify:CR=1 FL=1
MNEEKQNTKEHSNNGNILAITTFDKYKTVNELFERSQANSVYYTLLILSIIIVCTGLLLNTSAIVIGGMLVTPLLTPILVISLGIAVGEVKAIKIPAFLVFQSVAITIAISFLLTLAFGGEAFDPVLENTSRTAFLYFIVAIASGIAATFAWVRKEVADILPGVSIAVALLPPLSYVGIELALFSFETARFYGLIFIFNFLGIVLGSLIVFSLLKFHESGWAVHKKGVEVEKERAERKAEKTAQAAKKKMEQLKESVEKMQEMPATTQTETPPEAPTN